MPGAEPLAAVLDASIAVKWVVAEPSSEAAAALLDRPIAWIAPRLLLIEAAAALRRKVANAEIRAEAAASALAILIDAASQAMIRLADDERVVADALLLALALSHKLPDCLYLALAEREGVALATADARLAALARARNIHVLAIGAAVA